MKIVAIKRTGRDRERVICDDGSEYYRIEYNDSDGKKNIKWRCGIGSHHLDSSKLEKIYKEYGR